MTRMESVLICCIVALYALLAAGRVKVMTNREAATRVSATTFPHCQSVHTTDHRVMTRNSATWHDMRDDGGLQFALVWNAQFRSHEILWRNRGNRVVEFRYSADSLGHRDRRVHRRVLAPGITESLPGESIAPTRASGIVCVRLLKASLS